MLRLLGAASVAAMLSACSSLPPHLAAPADARSPHAGVSPGTLLADARSDEVGEPADWQDLNRRVAPPGGAHAR
jgi:hypothetical protein